MILKVNYHGVPGQVIEYGQLAIDQRGKIAFEMAASCIPKGLNLSPLEIKDTKGLQWGKYEHFRYMPGLFHDSLPDGWGLCLMDRFFAQQEIPKHTITPLTRLAYMGNRTMGALTYEPDTGGAKEPGNQELILDMMAQNAQEIYSGRTEEVVEGLRIAGGSPGGARPKAAIGILGNSCINGAEELPAGYEHWIVKFPPGDSLIALWEGVIEYAYASMAVKCDIDMPPFDLIASTTCPGFFAIKRFDRGADNQRIHMHTLAGLVGANFRVNDFDYQDFIKLTSHLTKRHDDVEQCYRRMVFNVLSGNRDDHTKNFSFIKDAHGAWRLSPAYDVTFSEGINQHHSMAIAGYTQNIENKTLLDVGVAAGLSERVAQGIIDLVSSELARWPDYVSQFGIPENVAKPVTDFLAQSRGR